MNITIFTDGASRGNPGPGGWAAVIVFGNDDGAKVSELGGSQNPATNNQMELLAALKALSTPLLQKAVKSKEEVSIIIHTDSSYLINGITKWVSGWKKKGWITSTKTEVENRELWESIDAAIDELKGAGVSVTWKYVGGHIGIKGNERCDVIATAFATGKKLEPALYEGSLGKYFIKEILDVSHSAVQKEAKKSDRSRSKAPAYSYVSEVGGVVQVHATWKECEARVTGKKARFKKALSPAEEAELIKEFSQ